MNINTRNIARSMLEVKFSENEVLITNTTQALELIDEMSRAILDLSNLISDLSKR